MISENNLIGWLVFIRAQGHEFPLNVPESIVSALIERGWWSEDGCMTEAGGDQTDLHAEEWGINPIPQETP